MKHVFIFWQSHFWMQTDLNKWFLWKNHRAESEQTEERKRVNEQWLGGDKVVFIRVSVCIFAAVGGTISAKGAIGLELVILLSEYTANCWFIIIKPLPTLPAVLGIQHRNTCWVRWFRHIGSCKLYFVMSIFSFDARCDICGGFFFSIFKQCQHYTLFAPPACQLPHTFHFPCNRDNNLRGLKFMPHSFLHTCHQ